MIRREPHAIWNAFVDIAGNAPYEELTPVQQVAWLAFQYDAEVQNGYTIRHCAPSYTRPGNRSSSRMRSACPRVKVLLKMLFA